MKSLLFMLACLATPVLAAESHSPTSEVRTAMQAHRELRDLATRELAVPGSIIKAITEHQMTVESGQR